MRNLIKNSSIILLLIILSFSSFSQGKKYVKRKRERVDIQYKNDIKIYARGIDVNEKYIFVSNNDGSIHYIDKKNYESYQLFKLPNFKELTDIDIINDSIFAMHSGDNGKMIKIAMNGRIKIQLFKNWLGVFFDAFDFYNQTGVVFGDPTNGYFNLFYTTNGGSSWNQCPHKIKSFDKEYGFAASGTNVQVLNDSSFVFITGGLKSRFFKTTDLGKTWLEVLIPFYPGETQGANSICFSENTNTGVIVGGDFREPNLSNNTCYYTEDGGETWFDSKQPPNGYRSCVIYANDVFYTCGTNGIDFSVDGGKTWYPFDDITGYAMAVDNEKLYVTGNTGTVHVYDLIKIKK